MPNDMSDKDSDYSRRSFMAGLLALFAVAATPDEAEAQSRRRRRRRSSRSRSRRGRGSSTPQRAHGGGGNYSSCAQARAAGAAPLRRGQAGYSSALDRDNDGVACE